MTSRGWCKRLHLLPLGPGAPGVDFCFLWLAALPEAICLNMESLSPHSLIAHVLPLLTVCGFGLGKSQGNYSGLYLYSEVFNHGK